MRTHQHPSAQTITVEFRPFDGPVRQIKVTGDQLHSRACVVGSGCSGTGLVAAGHVHTSTGPDRAPLGWPVVAHPQCISEAARAD